MQKILFGLILFALALPSLAADEKQQTELLRKLFRAPQSQWTEVMKQNMDLLDETFFERCEARIQWDLKNNQSEDAWRFAEVADAAAELMGKPAHFKAEVNGK